MYRCAVATGGWLLCLQSQQAALGTGRGSRTTLFFYILENIHSLVLVFSWGCVTETECQLQWLKQGPQVRLSLAKAKAGAAGQVPLLPCRQGAVRVTKPRHLWPPAAVAQQPPHPSHWPQACLKPLQSIVGLTCWCYCIIEGLYRYGELEFVWGWRIKRINGSGCANIHFPGQWGAAKVGRLRMRIQNPSFLALSWIMEWTHSQFLELVG